jgi:hypothetical protein
MQQASVHQQSTVEANNHRWIASEQAGCDLGMKAFYQWFHDHWNGFLRARWLEHLEGKIFWTELDRGDFGLLRHRFDDSTTPLLSLIIERLKAGKENLDILWWALDTHQPVHEIREILEILDINSRRLAHRFECAS